MTIFDPKGDHNIDQEARLVFYDIEEQGFHQMVIIKPGEKHELVDANIINNPLRYKYKYQVKNEYRWIDATKYIRFTSNQYYDFILDKDNISNYEPIINILNGKTEEHKIIREKFIYLLFNEIWHNPKAKHKNANDIVQYVNELPADQVSLDVADYEFYINQYLQLKRFFIQNKFIDVSYFNLRNLTSISSHPLRKQLQEIISSTGKKNFPPYKYLLQGKLESFLENRKNAGEAFRAFLKSNLDNVPGIDQGVYTYSKVVQDQPISYEIEFLSDLRTRAELTFLMSMDERFLRLYGLPILYIANILPQYHFHFHIVGQREIVNHSVDDFLKLHHLMKTFTQNFSSSGNVFFSFEETPTIVMEKRTYYACARFLHANKIMERYESDILIMDIDLILKDDPTLYLTFLHQYDVSMPVSSGIISLCPWRRFLGGNVYLKNNLLARHFLRSVHKYISAHLDQPTSWTLDQNALCYAYETMANENPEFKFGDVNDYSRKTGKSRPFLQGSIRQLIEKFN